MAAALSFQENAVDAVAVKNMGQKQTGRAAADDRHLGALRRRCHCRLSKKGCWLSKGSIAEIRKSILQARVGFTPYHIVAGNAALYSTAN
jgi:hypothetical protein